MERVERVELVERGEQHHVDQEPEERQKVEEDLYIQQSHRCYGAIMSLVKYEYATAFRKLLEVPKAKDALMSVVATLINKEVMYN